MSKLLNRCNVAMHPFGDEELSLGSLRTRAGVLADLDFSLGCFRIAQDHEVRHMIEQHRFYSRGIGWIDANLLATVALNDELRLWTRDKRLPKLAEDLALHASWV